MWKGTLWRSPTRSQVILLCPPEGTFVPWLFKERLADSDKTCAQACAQADLSPLGAHVRKCIFSRYTSCDQYSYNYIPVYLHLHLFSTQNIDDGFRWQTCDTILIINPPTCATPKYFFMRAISFRKDQFVWTLNPLLSEQKVLTFKSLVTSRFVFVLRFYGPFNPMGSCPARTVYLTTRLLGRLSPLSGQPVLCTFFRQKLTTALLESAEGREWP